MACLYDSLLLTKHVECDTNHVLSLLRPDVTLRSGRYEAELPLTRNVIAKWPIMRQNSQLHVDWFQIHCTCRSEPGSSTTPTTPWSEQGWLQCARCAK